MCAHSAMFNSATHGLQLARLLCPWDSQARILEWVAISSWGGSSQLRDQPASPLSPALAGGFFTTEPSGKPILTLATSIVMWLVPSLFNNASATMITKPDKDTTTEQLSFNEYAAKILKH